MLVLGISGSLYAESWHERPPKVPFRSDFENNHDAAAVLLDGGEVVAAIEQERIDRIKHAGGLPVDAMEACLALHGCRLPDVDLIACSYSHAGLRNSLLNCEVNQRSQRGDVMETTPEIFLQQAFERAFGQAVDAKKIRFVKHHLAHAASAFFPSEFDRALVATIDGAGEDESGSLCIGDGCDIRLIRPLRHEESLGLFYLNVIRVLGFRMFDEYKVMGLAPYGDPGVYELAVSELYELKPEGGCVFHRTRVSALATRIPRPDHGAPFQQPHMDLAAALQAALERIAFHLLGHAQKQTGLRQLCLAGGVAHNCTLNGKLLSSGLFDRVFVQPAAHDAGMALGAAGMTYRQATGRRPAPATHVYLGRSAGSDDQIEAECRKWSDFLEIRRSANVVGDAAALMAEGKIIAWVQDRSEFGPRALGNRSILADPRPAENKGLINALIKKRESFRPFAPAVVAEQAAEYFVIRDAADFAYMTFVVSVKPDKRALLGAITHVDGTARLQTVTRAANPKFWSLISEFGRITGVPVVLNTSFNNNAEPIVDSVTDAIVTFLTTGLDALVVGSMIVRRKAVSPERHLRLVPRLPAHLELRDSLHRERSGRLDRRLEIRPLRARAGSVATGTRVSEAMSDVLRDGSGRPAGEIVAGSARVDTGRLAEELVALWGKRLIELSPVAARPGASHEAGAQPAIVADEVPA